MRQREYGTALYLIDLIFAFRVWALAKYIDPIEASQRLKFMKTMTCYRTEHFPFKSVLNTYKKIIEKNDKERFSNCC